MPHLSPLMWVSLYFLILTLMMSSIISFNTSKPSLCQRILYI